MFDKKLLYKLYIYIYIKKRNYQYSDKSEDLFYTTFITKINNIH